jgi:capsular polysaccharide export protein
VKAENAPAPRNFLFLQGMATRFFARLGAALADRGHAVHRVNFNGGDRLFWPLSGAVDYTGDLKGWPDFLERLLSGRQVTDIILFGDCRPLHREAIRVAILRGILVHVFEEGYLRPNWITLEPGGVNGHSSLPRDPAWFRAAAADLPPWDGGLEVRGSFFRRATEDVAYNVATVLLEWRYPNYCTHRPWHPFVEYAGWLRRFATRPLAKRRSALSEAVLQAGARPHYLFPLQLDCDSQIRQHSPFGRLQPALETVIASFARHAPPDSLLVVKEHPLDNGIRNWRRQSLRLADEAGVGHRLVYLERGDLVATLQGSLGVVTVNSTVGFLALSFGIPLIALGEAIYDMPRLTFQDGLDRFWREGAPPDPTTFDDFRRVTAARTQVNGGFFSPLALARAVAGSVERMEAASDARPRTAMVPDAASAGGLDAIRGEALFSS